MEPTFYGWYTNKIDAKGRVSVPAPFRQQVTSPQFHGMIAKPSDKHPMIEGSGTARTEWMLHQLETLSESSEEYDAVQAMFSETLPIPFDGEGRIVLPQVLIVHARLTDAVLFAGGGNIFQMWEPGAYEKYKAAMRERRRQGGPLFQPRRPLREPAS